MGKQSRLCSQCIIYSNNWRWDTLSPDGPAWPGFPWGPGAPCTKPDRKQCQSVSSWSIFTARKSWCRLPHCYCEVCPENFSSHSTLTCVPIQRICVCVCVGWWVRYLVIVLGVEVNGKWGSLELFHHMDVVFQPSVASHSAATPTQTQICQTS